MHHHHFAGGVTDLSQCFDRIIRQQIYPIALHAGIPLIISTYARHPQNTSLFRLNLRVSGNYFATLVGYQLAEYGV